MASSVPIRLTAAGLVVVPASIDGRGEYPSLPDTGAESTIVDTTLAAELGLKSAGRLPLLTSTGVAGVETARASIRFGAVGARDVQVLQMPLDAVRAYAPDVRGVLGNDVLRRANWLLDYRRATLTHDRDGAIGRMLGADGPRLPIRWIDGRAAVRAEFGGGTGELVLDSAAARTLLFDRPKPAAGIVDTGERLSIQSLSGREQVPAITIEALQVGAVVIREVKAAVLDRVSPKPKEGGILPTALFGTLYFDYRRDAIIVTPAR